MTVTGLALKSSRNAALIAQDGSTREKFLGRLLEYIPGDVVAGYTAVLALVGTKDASFTAEWVAAYVFLVLSPAVLLGLFVGSFKKTNNRFPRAKEYPWFRIIAAPVAFVAWVIALPNSPIFDWGTPAGWVQFLVLAVTTIGLAVLGGIWDKSS